MCLVAALRAVFGAVCDLRLLFCLLVCRVAALRAPGALPLNNRLVLAPLTRGRAGPSRVPNAIMGEYYRQRAGFGLIVTEVRFPRLPALGSLSSHTGFQSPHHCHDQTLAPLHT